ncbi:MAG: hypothetical protein F6K40_32640 [Okeania sp. SIO3I5]|uniref:hypothetical protein n=1 Tax=Okeania sp. SIO3I5 TaxID=2607805 RepID=UPI0013B7D20D|nr:hypothetical protein [Okeania sp. SIO3I5]NEQ40717.1 hypothetical protein [Okeania sp. SIO3I5]
MWQSSQGIPNIPDITHPEELIELGNQIIQASLILIILTFFLGIGIAIINFSIPSRQESEPNNLINELVSQYSSLLKKLPHLILVLILLVGGFFLCSTLSNRYHNWEQAKISKIAAGVAGDRASGTEFYRLEQIAPKVRYIVEEPYTYYQWVENKQVEIKSTRNVDKFLNINASKIQVNINQAKDVQNLKAVYVVDFSAEYQVTNQLQNIQEFFFDIRPPYGYSLLQNFRVEQNNKRLIPTNPGNYSFPFNLSPEETINFKVNYQAQGAPRWIYNANNQLLSNFRLIALANFPKADFASGIVPTETIESNPGRKFTWVFDDNVSVKNPFGVFTATDSVKNTGILPRLLILAPLLFLWWLILLYFSLPLSLRDVAILGGIFFACLLTLTYFSRFMDAKFSWSLISPILLFLVWGLGSNRQASFAAIICTISGGILPIFALLIPYSGLTLSIAGLLSVVWLVVRHWYGWYSVNNSFN